MTVSRTPRSAGPFVGNGVTTAFPFAFKVFFADDLEVTFTDANGVASVITGGYTVTLNADQDANPGGTITYPSAGAPMAAPATLAIAGDAAYEQRTDLTNAGRFLPQAIENALDLVTILAQQLFDKARRALVYPAGDAASGTLPSAGLRAGKYLAFDGAGAPTMASGTGADAGLRTDLAASGGSALVKATLPASSGGVVIPSFTLDFFVKSSPIDLRAALPGGYVTDGSVDYSAYVQKVMDYVKDYGGGKVLLPANLMVMISNLAVYTGTEIIAPEWSAGFVVKSGGMGLCVNNGSGGTSNPDDNQRNIRFSGFQVRGQNAVPVFSEFEYLLNLNAISDFLGEDLLIKGFQGDGVHFGSSNSPGVERHNERCRLSRVTIDGINAANRNGISVIDGTHMTLEKLRILNTTKAGMPGGIDLEPNVDAFARIRHVTIDDFEIDGGSGSGVTFLLPVNSTLTTPIEHLRVKNGRIKNKDTGFAQLTNAPAAGQPHNTVWEELTVAGCDTPFIIDAVDGAVLDAVRCYDAPKQAQLGYTQGNRNITIRDLKMARCGNVETNALLVRTIDGLTIDNARFTDNGITAGGSGRAIYFSGGTGANVSIINTTIEAPTGLTTVNIAISGTYTLDKPSCASINNRFLPAALNDFKVTQSRAVFRNYQLVEDFNCALYDFISLNVQANFALTYNAPTGMVTGQELTIRVRNGTGGAMGVITWNAVFKMSSWTNPANAKSRTIKFAYDGTNWIETFQSAGDVSN